MQFSIAPKVKLHLSPDQLAMLRPQYRSGGTNLSLDVPGDYSADDEAVVLASLGGWFKKHAKGKYPVKDDGSIPDKAMTRFIHQTDKLPLHQYGLLAPLTSALVEDDSPLATYVAAATKINQERDARISGWLDDEYSAVGGKW